MRRFAALLAILVLPISAQDRVDSNLVGKIKTQAFDHSKVMDTMFYISDVYGPRLTGSPEFEQAANWAAERLRGYGLDNVHMEKWGPFGRAWSLKSSSVEILEPRYAQLDAIPLAWSSSTNGPVSGDLVIAPFASSFVDGPKKLHEAFEEYKKKWSGKLRGKIVLTSALQVPKPSSDAKFTRYTPAQLGDMVSAPDPAVKSDAKSLTEVEWPSNPADFGKFFASMPNALLDEIFAFYDKSFAERGEFFAKEGVLGVLTEDGRSHNGLIHAEAAGSFKAGDVAAPPTFVLTAEQYDRIARLVEKKLPVQVRLNLKATLSDGNVDGLNIIGEIPGTTKKDEIVMIGAHFDSWHSGTGATDNGAGSAVMIEVMRILKALNMKFDRTIRIGLWSGEEEGLFGSLAYVKEHFGDPKTMHITEQHAKLSGYFNLDNGSGKIRGVYLQGNEGMRSIFESWLSPFRDMGATTVTIRNTGGTDHLSFDAVGLPGFQFIQDPLDYGSMTHHSNMDTYDHVVPEDMMQASAIIATVVVEAANRPDMLPRKELPKALHSTE